MSLTDYYTHAGIPKPTPRKKVKAKKKCADAKGLKAFRDAVWKRERWWWDDEADYALCQGCGEGVKRTKGYQSADVHHKVGRRTKGTRYDPSNGVLLCNHLVNDCHRKAHKQ